MTADLSTTATGASPAGYYPILANVSSLVAANYQLGGVQDGTLTMKPAVMNVLVRLDSGQSVSLVGLGRDLPFVNIRTIQVVFSDNVDLSGATTQLLGINVPNYAISAPATTRRPSPRPGRYRWARRRSTDAQPHRDYGAAGQRDRAEHRGRPVQRRLRRPAGRRRRRWRRDDRRRDRLRDHIQAFGGQYLIWADVDGSGIIDLTDLTAVRNRIGLVRRRRDRDSPEDPAQGAAAPSGRPRVLGPRGRPAVEARDRVSPPRRPMTPMDRSTLAPTGRPAHTPAGPSRLAVLPSWRAACWPRPPRRGPDWC